MTENGKTRVLIVDDSIGICRTMAMIFERKGFDADYTLDGAKAIEAVKKADYGVIFMDIKMPGMDGVSTYREIKKISPNVRVAIITAYAVEERVQQALDEGVKCVFYKPLDMDAVIDFAKSGPVKR